MPGYYKKASPLPVSQSQREILEQIVRRSKSQQQHVKRAREIVADISPRQVGRFLKGGRSKAASSAVLGTATGCG